MSQTEIISNHEVYTTLKEAIRLSSELRSKEGISLEYLEPLDETHYVLFMFESLLQKADPLLVSSRTLDNVNTNANNIIANLQEIQRNPSIGHLNNVKSYTINIIDYVHQVYFPKNIDEIESVREATVSFRMSIGQHLRHVTNEIEDRSDQLNDLESQLVEVKQQFQSLQTRSENIISEFQRQFSEAEATRQRDYNTSISQRDQQFNNELESYNNKLSEFEDQLESDRAQHQDKFNEYIEAFKIEQQKLVARSETFMSKLDEYQTAAKKILGTITIDGHAAAYQNVANSARKTKYIWQVGTVILFLLLIISAVLNAFGVSNSFNWAQLAAKWSVTLAIGAAVAYTARQAARQDQVERENRNMELQMATIDPYLEIFSEDERKEIKKQLVDRIFTGYTVKEEQLNHQIASNSELGKIIEGVIAAVIKK
jgi:uncharacterized integral membrane protein